MVPVSPLFLRMCRLLDSVNTQSGTVYFTRPRLVWIWNSAAIFGSAGFRLFRPPSPLVPAMAVARITRLRELLKAEKLAAFVCPTDDAHLVS